MNASIYDIINQINSSLTEIKGNWQGVASNVKRGEVTTPEINERYAGADDTQPVSAYHKLISLVSDIAPNTAVGRDAGDMRNKYTNQLVVFVDKKKCDMYPDEVLLVIQSLFPETLKMPPYRSIRLAWGTVILDTQTVYQQEYTNAQYRMKPNQYLMKINYTVETTFKKGCFRACP